MAKPDYRISRQEFQELGELPTDFSVQAATSDFKDLIGSQWVPTWPT
jgi:hypothetical protein